MRFILALAMALVASAAVADTNIYARRVTISSAQDHAVVIARRGSLVHSVLWQAFARTFVAEWGDRSQVIFLKNKNK